jgi:alkylated DNA repair dioxygenase AlkB
MELPPGFAHYPKWAEFDLALNALTRELLWQQPTIKMFGKAVKIPRMVAWMGDWTYSYSGTTHKPAPWHPIARSIKIALELELGVEFNSCLANLYRDGLDSVSWHADNEPELGLEPTIASLSFGASRAFQIKTREGKARWSTTLCNDDLLVMNGRSQLDYLHCVPKDPKAEGPRINLTFRKVEA